MKALLWLRGGFVTLVSAVCVIAQPDALDVSFDPGAGANGPIYATLRQPDGKLLVGGSFTTFDDQPLARLVRLNPDGSVDLSFHSAFGGGADLPVAGGILSLALQADGKILIAGSFLSVDGVPRRSIARLNSDGSLDPSFDPGSGTDFSINTIRVTSEGQIVISGSFSTVDGLPRNRLARLHSDGKVDDEFPAGSGPSGSVRALEIQPDGKLLIGGFFTSVNETTRNRIARLHPDGTVDTTFNPGSGPNLSVHSILVDESGRILMGGNFTRIGNVPRNRIARLKPDGSLDMSFDAGTGPNLTVETLALQPDGRILIGGPFSVMDGFAWSGIARLFADGSLDYSFNPDLGAETTVRSILVQEDEGGILIGGWFTSVDEVPQGRIARLIGEGEPIPAEPVITIHPQDTTAPWGQPAGFDFRMKSFEKPELQWQFNEVDIPGETNPILTLAHVDWESAGSYRVRISNSAGSVASSGATLTVTEPPTDPGLPDESFLLRESDLMVNSIALQPDGKMVLAGDSLTGGSVSVNRLLRLKPDGSADEVIRPAVSHEIFAVHLQPDGRILIGGRFIHVNLATRHYLARLNSDLNLDTEFSAGPMTVAIGSGVHAILPQPDGRVLIGGGLLSVQGIERKGLARLNSDGSLDTGFLEGESGFDFASTSVPAIVRVIRPLEGNRLLVGGHFDRVNGVMRRALALLNEDGSLDASFDAALEGGEVYTIEVQPDGKLLIGGDFRTSGGVSRAGIVRLHADGSLDPSFFPGSGTGTFASPVRAMALQPDGKILLGGSFTAYDGVTRNRLARLHPDGSLDRTFAQGQGANGQVSAMALLDDGRILIGGLFTRVNGVPHQRVALLFGGDVDPSQPEITSEPQDLTLPAGGVGTLRVVADGLPLAFQWHKDGEPIATATNSHYSIFNAAIAHSGDYFVVVSNSLGVVTSQAAVVNVEASAPQFLTQPQSIRAPEAGVAQFSVTVTGAPPARLQWQFEGVDLPGQTNATLRIVDVSSAHAGTYRARASNEIDSVWSNSAILTVVPPIALAEALGAPHRSWTTGGDAPWFGQFAMTPDGAPAAQSGPIGDNEESWIETTLPGPGLLTFWWNVSSDVGDRLWFSYPGHAWVIAGYRQWEQLAFSFGAGTHTVRWSYRKDAVGSGRLDAAWVAQVRFFPAGSEPFEISRPRITPNGGLELNLLSAIGQSHLIEQSMDLVHWFPWTNFVSTSYVTRFNIPPDGAPHRFFRATRLE